MSGSKFIVFRIFGKHAEIGATEPATVATLDTDRDLCLDQLLLRLKEATDPARGVQDLYPIPFLFLQDEEIPRPSVRSPSPGENGRFGYGSRSPSPRRNSMSPVGFVEDPRSTSIVEPAGQRGD
ncbi:hypothetical protein OROHE_019024 [Orobanche hederae]